MNAGELSQQLGESICCGFLISGGFISVVKNLGWINISWKIENKSIIRLIS